MEWDGLYVGWMVIAKGRIDGGTRYIIDWLGFVDYNRLITLIYVPSFHIPSVV